MPRRLLVLNVILVIVSVAFAVGIVRTLLVKRPVPQSAATRPAVAAPPATAVGAAEPNPEAYAVIAAQNLFNPARSETASAAAALPVVKPILHGVVIDGPKSRAFLEDPTAKRVSGYSVGDSVGGGRIQTIADDRVVIARPEGMMEVLLQDPSKPRPASTIAGGPAVTAGPGQPAAGQPGPGQFGPAQFGPGQSGPGQPGPGQSAPVQVAPVSPGAPPNQPQAMPPQFRRRLGSQGQPANEQ
jgi:hypothetical protein